MKKQNKLKIGLVLICCWTISFICSNFFLSKIDIINCLKEIKSLENIENIDFLKNTFNKVFSFTIANIFSIISTFIAYKKFNSETLPILHLRVINTTSIRKGKLKNITPEILIGQGRYYIYVTAHIQNVGIGVIENCKINNQSLELEPLHAKEELIIYFRISIPDNKLREKYYGINVDFNDAFDRTYQKKYELKVNTEKQMSQFIVKKKQRRKYKK